jgi:ribosomal protein L12E/L44/L45/RPP1/RPP2
MSQISLNEYQIKSIFKAAIVEVLEERKDLLAEVLEEVLENIGLITAIKAGEESEKVSREEVFKLLRSERESQI